jgi:hypothetical protein
MAIIPTSAERAQSNVAKAEATVSEWQAKAAAARADAAELDATAGAAILADESAAERVTLQVQTLERKARAYDQAATEAGKNLRTARLAVLTTEADTLEKEAAKVRRVLDKHNAEVAKAKDALEELAGHGFIPGEPEPEGVTISVPGETISRTSRVGKAAPLNRQAMHMETQAQCIRYWLKRGELPRDLHDLNKEFGQTHAAFVSVLGSDYLDKYGAPITDNLRAAVDAGL